jgi:hypothetical protein
MGRGWKRTDVNASAPRQSFTRQFSLGFYTELEKLLGDAKGKRTSEKHSLGGNTDALCSGGPSRSSDEAE